MCWIMQYWSSAERMVCRAHGNAVEPAKAIPVPTFLFINKMDQPGTVQEVLLSELQKRLSESCVDFALLDGQKENVPEEVWETIAMSEEELLEQYLENGSIPEQEIRRLIRQRKLFPCYFGSALKLKGVEELLNGWNAGWAK